MGLGVQREALIDSTRKLEVLRGRERRLEEELGQVKAQIMSLAQVVKALTDLVDADFPFPDEQAPEIPSTSRPHEATAEPVVANGSSRADAVNVVALKQSRTRADDIRDLVGQEPTRWWKARDVADSLAVTNVKSLRMTLNTMVKRKVLIKHQVSPSDTWYRYNDGVARPGPVGGHVGAASTKQGGAAM